MGQKSGRKLPHIGSGSHQLANIKSFESKERVESINNPKYPMSYTIKPRIICSPIKQTVALFPQEGSENEEEEREEEEEENTDYLTDSNKENETDEENNVRSNMKSCR